ncbi:MAG: PLP-dependent aminotransferase family protein [Oscillospiraceae bacterium]|nr:PLP-dependent aminotransferase family protein [Oscillospiraceae bacterium]
MQKYARRMDRMMETAAVVKGLFGALGDPELISLGIGAPAKEALPVDILREISNDILRTESRGIEALQYGPTVGIKDLREVIAEQLLAPKGVHVSPDQIMITVGGLEGISLTCELFIDPGDIILVEKPTFVHAVETFDMFEARCIGVEMDDDGMILEDLEEKIKKYHPKMVYVIPTFQNPSGRTMCLARRKRLAEIAAEYDVLVMEDDPYRDIRYSGEDLAPIKSFDTSGNVILGNSFSKIFSAGSRLGYLVASDAKMMEYMKDAKSALNSHTSLLPQILCAEFFKRGYFPAHHKMICDLYRERRDTMVESIRAYFPEGTKFVYPDGGLFTWAQLPGGLNTAELLKESVARPDVKVSYVAGEKFFTDGEPVTNCMRLSFGAIPPEKIRTAVARLGAMLCEKLR